ncbi:MAG: hypothetical protein AABY46_07265 [Nitrospirota bacterium]
MADTYLFPHTCTIQRRASASNNELGQPVYTWSNNQTGVACTFQPAGMRELAGRFTSEVEVDRLFLPDGIDVLIEDRISTIANSSGVTIAAGPYQIVSKTPWDGSHVELNLELVR